MATKTMLETLQQELAEKRQKVKDCDQALAKAKAEVDAYVAKVAEALGLPNPVAREEKRQTTLAARKRVRSLLADGKTTAEIIDIVMAGEGASKFDAETIGEMVVKLQKPTGQDATPESRPLRQAPESGERGYKRERIRQLFLEGKSRVEIAEELGIDKTNVNAHITQLRNSGKLPRPEDVAAAGDDDDGDSIEDLREEVTRQQGGKRSAVARLSMIEQSGHVHVAVVDRMGDGVTQPDETGHQHRVCRFVLSMAAGHQHGLLAKEVEAA